MHSPFARVLAFFKTGPDKPLLDDPALVRKIYERKRWSVLLSLIFGYGFFYICRLSLSVTKGPLLDSGLLNVKQLGMIGAGLLYIYAAGKFVNGFLSDRANIRRFMSIALIGSAIVNLCFGLSSHFYLFLGLWILNGWFQSVGSAPSVVSLCQWFSNKERGSRYAIWAGAHNIGEGLTFIITSTLVSYLGWRAGFIGPGIICLVVAAVLYFTLADRPQTYGLPHVTDYKQDYSAGVPRKGSVGQLQMEVLKSPVVWALGMSSALMYVTRYAIHSWGPLYLQQAKDYSIMESGFMIGIGTIPGLCGAILSGVISDRYFQSRRNVPCLLYNLLLIGSLTLLYLIPPGHRNLDFIAIAGFEFAIGGLIVFLAGLIAVDVFPKTVAGAVKGTIGLFSYIAAGSQYWINGLLLDAEKSVVDGVTHYNFNYAFYFWIGCAVVSMLLALTVWNIRPKE
jgi:OPA family sugar phosphate sensor protein UhpC-like MFS transporter